MANDGDELIDLQVNKQWPAEKVPAVMNLSVAEVTTAKSLFPNACGNSRIISLNKNISEICQTR